MVVIATRELRVIMRGKDLLRESLRKMCVKTRTFMQNIEKTWLKTTLAMGAAVLVLRKETERPEAVEMGTVKLSGINQADIVNDACELLTDKRVYNRMATAVNPYGDGNASSRILEAVKTYLTK